MPKSYSFYQSPNCKNCKNATSYYYKICINNYHLGANQCYLMLEFKTSLSKMRDSKKISNKEK